MDRLGSMDREELGRDRIELEDGKICDLVSYNVKDYGFAEYVENVGISNGEFRRSRSLMPFNYLDVKPSFFNWSAYGEDTSAIKQYANAFIVKFEEFKAEGKGIYIHSKTKGSGKTLLV